MGTLCLIDQRPRQFGEEERQVFHELAALAERELNLADALELQRRLLEAQETSEKLLLNILPDKYGLEKISCATGTSLKTGGSFT